MGSETLITSTDGHHVFIMSRWFRNLQAHELHKQIKIKKVNVEHPFHVPRLTKKHDVGVVQAQRDTKGILSLNSDINVLN